MKWHTHRCATGVKPKCTCLASLFTTIVAPMDGTLMTFYSCTLTSIDTYDSLGIIVQSTHISLDMLKSMACSKLVRLLKSYRL